MKGNQEDNQLSLQTEEATLKTPKLLKNQLLATKFFAPVTATTPIPRLRLTTLLQQSLKYPLTLVSAPAGFGKTTLLSAWGQSLPAKGPKLAWVSLDEDDNEPHLFWTYVVTALNILHPDRFTPLLTQLQSPQPPSPKYIVIGLINALAEGIEQFVLVLDDYHLITEEQVHSTLSYLLEHLPIQLHIILSTRADPPLPLLQLRARQQLLEVRTDQLRSTTEETKALFKEAKGIQLSDETIQEMTTRTEGWLVGLHLLSLSIGEHTDPLTLVQEISGDQHYILGYLTQEVLRRQPQDVQTFLLSTCILERLTTSLCDAVMQTSDSQQMLQRLEQANLFVVSLDNRRQWYRYHALFAEALYYQLKLIHADLVPILHYRASLWYAEHDQTTQAILHALHAKEWQWAATLIERKHLALTTHTWAASEHEMVLLQHWIEQLPTDILRSRPDLCITSTLLLWQIAPHPTLHTWLDIAEASLTASLTTEKDTSSPMLTPEERQRLTYLLGSATITRAYLRSFEQDGRAALSLCQQALTVLPTQSFVARSYIANIQLLAYYTSPANDAVAAIQSGLQAVPLAQATEQAALIVTTMGTVALYMIRAGRLHEARQLNQQAMQLGMQQEKRILHNIGWPSVLQAEILRERNQLDTALSLVEEGIEIQKQTLSMTKLTYLLHGYSILLRIHLSRGELDEAHSALQQIEQIGMRMNQSVYLYEHSLFITVDQVRLWLASKELDRAIRWAEELDLIRRHGTPFAYEREAVALARILLAREQPTLALERLEPVLERATTGQRWGQVIETRLLQALAHQMLHEEMQALDALSEAIGLAEPEGYIRSFVDEGALMEALLHRLHRCEDKQEPMAYLDTLLAAFQQENKAQLHRNEQTTAQQLPEPLSKRELQVLQLLAYGASNQEISQELVITIDTVKRHVSHIFAKLGVNNRLQAVKQAQGLGLLEEKL